MTPKLTEAEELIRRWHEIQEAMGAFCDTHPESVPEMTVPVAAQWSALVDLQSAWREDAGKMGSALVQLLRDAAAKDGKP